MVRYVYDFREGRRDMADLLGGKGANLAEMTRLGLPAPPFRVPVARLGAGLAALSGTDGSDRR
jgi:pyruvate, orthophosphate dikinase